MSLTQYYTATTLDGFIADPDNSLDWLFTREREEDGPLNYDEFIAGVGALAMGSTTYEWILDHEFADKDPAEWKWPYDIPCWVFTHRQLPVVPDCASRVHERGRRNRARGDGRGRRRPEHLDRRRRRPGRSVRRRRAARQVICRLRRSRWARARRCCRAGSSCAWTSWGRNGDFASAKFSAVKT